MTVIGKLAFGVGFLVGLWPWYLLAALIAALVFLR